MAKFDSKSFNPQAFKYLVDRVPNLNIPEMIKSKALAPDSDIRNLFKAQDGTAYARMVQKGLLDGDVVNYDGQTDIEATSTKTFEKGVVVFGRAKAWVEKDFSEDITGGQDFMKNVANQIGAYWDGKNQGTLLAILRGIFSMTGTANLKFVNGHTYSTVGYDDGKVTATTLNSAGNKACGKNKKTFTMIFMHPDVATNIQNLNLLQHLKYTDKDGITRDLAIGTWNGKMVIEDDSLPTDSVISTPETKGVYTITIGTKGIAGDKITVGGVEYTIGDTTDYAAKTLAVGTSNTTQATALKTVLETQYDGIFTVTTSTNTVVLTQITGGAGESPVVEATKTTSGTIVAAIATTTSGVAQVINTTYTSYMLGEGAFDYEDIGAAVPFAMVRDEKTDGGQTYLYSRERKVISPKGISYEKTSQASLSPTDDEFRMGANWALVHSGETNEADRSYFDHRAIPIARIISKG